MKLFPWLQTFVQPHAQSRKRSKILVSKYGFRLESIENITGPYSFSWSPSHKISNIRLKTSRASSSEGLLCVCTIVLSFICFALLVWSCYFSPSRIFDTARAVPQVQLTHQSRTQFRKKWSFVTYLSCTLRYRSWRKMSHTVKSGRVLLSKNTEQFCTKRYVHGCRQDEQSGQTT